MINSEKDIVKKIAKDLKLKEGDQYTQDWELEVADLRRIDEFFNYYIENINMNFAGKRALIKIILESYNDYVGEYGVNKEYSKVLQQILEKDFLIFEDIIEYWSCEEDELEDSFYITPLLRNINH